LAQAVNISTQNIFQTKSDESNYPECPVAKILGNMARTFLSFLFLMRIAVSLQWIAPSD